MEFNKDIKIKCLLWCDRHCCLCKKSCGIDIEVAHIDEKDDNQNNIDNAIPLCYDCHAKISHYNIKQPLGNKYSFEELRRRRDQIYEEYTRHLVPPISYEITQNLINGRQRIFPDIGFNIHHLGSSLPIKALVGTEIFLDSQCLKKRTDGKGHYGMGKFWNLNPGLGYMAHFPLPEGTVDSNGRLKIIVHVIIVDQYEKNHELLPTSWVYERTGSYW